MGYIDPKLVEGAAAVVESFTCAICFNLFEKPRTACSKGHTFCAECLTAARARAPDNCPTCREDSELNVPSKPLENMLDELRIRCCHGPDATTVEEERGAKRQKIRDGHNIPVAQQRLIFKKKELIDGKRLYESNVFDGATMHVVLRLARGN